jgi:hypothetical protein
MSKKEKRKSEADLLPPREALSLVTPDPSAYSGLLGDATVPSAGPADPAAGAASSTAGSAQNLADAQASADGQETVSDQDQTVSTESSQSASSET